MLRSVLLAAAVTSACPAMAAARQAPPSTGAVATTRAGQGEPPRFEETVVVSAARTDEKLLDARATTTVIAGPVLERASPFGIADVLRTVPGANVIQVSARDVNITTRQSVSVGANHMLVLLDGRRINLDFYGMVAWDLLPIDAEEILQVEVVRGPASTVWGSNALSGVVNVISRSPREMPATWVTLGAGLFGRNEGDRAGSLYSVSAGHAWTPTERTSLKVSAGARHQGALARPPNGAGFEFANTGTTQPRFDARVDHEFAAGGTLVASGGAAATSGMFHTALGPFDIRRGTGLGYARTTYTQGAFRIAGSFSLLNGRASNLLTRDPSGAPLEFAFVNHTYAVETGNTRAFGAHAITYGGDLRVNTFDFSLAPLGTSRREGGAYAEDEVNIRPAVRVSAGTRVDWFDSIARLVFSPRATVALSLTPHQVVRASVSRAYRAPSFFENFLDLPLAGQLDLGVLNPRLAGRQFVFPIHAVGNANLVQESATAWEVAYTATLLHRALISIAGYRNRAADSIFLTQTAAYSEASPPQGWPLPARTLDALAASGHPLPSEFSYRNLGRVVDKGIELGLNVSVTPRLHAYVNHSMQATPVPDFDIGELNLPPRHRFNAGIDADRRALSGALSVSHCGQAYWQDVPDPRLRGVTRPYTVVNATVAVWMPGRRAAVAAKITNVFNRVVQQQVFGDLLRRQVLFELRIREPAHTR